MFQIYTGESLVYEPGDSNLVLLAPKLTLEMGKAGSLEFTVPAGHPYMDSLKQLTSPVSVQLDGENIFRGRVLSGTRTFYNQREMYCEGDLSYLVDSVQKAVKFNGKTHALFRQIIANHNARMPAEKQFTVGNITVPDQNIILTGQSEEVGQYDYSQIAINSVVDNWNNTYDYIETCLISYCGGYLMTRREGNTTYLDWVSDYTSTATQEIVFGENMLDFTDETTAEDIFTVLIPIGDNNLTIASVNGGSDELVNAEAVSKYGRIVKTNVFSNVTSATTLKENGLRFLANNGDIPTTFTLTAVDLHSIYPEIKAIQLGDRVYIRSDPHGLSQYLTCTKIEYDLEKPENTVYTFGREKQSLTYRYREDKRIQNDTYGNNAVSGGGGGIGAAAADMGGGWHWLDDNMTEKIEESEEEQDEKMEAKLTEFYDAYINLLPEQGKIDLGALYQKLMNDEAVLENNVGINMDAPAGTINIFTDHQNLQDTTSTANDASNKTARILLWAGEDGQGNIGSNIALEADLVTVSNRLQALEGIFSSITTETAYASKGISSHTFYGSNFYVSTGDDSNEVNLASHSHNIIESSDGGLLLTGPIPLSSRVPFRIADTKEYKDGVSAVHIETTSGIFYATGSDHSAFVAEANSRYISGVLYGLVNAELSNDTSETILVGIDPTKVIDSIDVSSTAGTSYTTGTDHSANVTDANARYISGMLYGVINVTLSNGITRSVLVGFDATKAYNAGYTAGSSAGASAVRIQTTYGTTYATGTDHSANVTDANARYISGMLYGVVNATMTNGVTESIYIGFDATKAYNSGNSAGYSSGYSAGYGVGYNNGYSAGRASVPQGGISTIYITAINSSSVGVRAYHPGGGYDFHWLSVGSTWDGYN